MKPRSIFKRRDPVEIMQKLLMESFTVFPYLTIKQRVELFTEELEFLSKATFPGKRQDISKRDVVFCPKHGLRFLVRGECASCYANKTRRKNRDEVEAKLNSHNSDNS